MSVLTWLRDRAPVVLGVALLATAGLSVAVVGVALLALGTGTDPLVVLGGTVATLALLATVATATGLALAWTLLTRLGGALGVALHALRAGASERLARVESRTPLSRLGLADRVAPSEYTPLLDPLKQRYVDGDLTEWEFERRLDALLDAGRVDADRVSAAMDHESGDGDGVGSDPDPDSNPNSNSNSVPDPNPDSDAVLDRVTDADGPTDGLTTEDGTRSARSRRDVDVDLD